MYFTYKLIHESFLTVILIGFFSITFFLFLKKRRNEATLNSISLLMFLLLVYSIFPWKNISILYVNYSAFLGLITFLTTLILVKSFNRNILSELSLKDKVTSLVLILIFGTPVAFSLITSNEKKNDFVNVGYPFQRGEFLVIQGGNNFFINHHHFFSDQKFALDVIKSCESDSIHKNRFENNEAFCIWNEPLVSVCNGTIKESVGNLKDNLPAKESDVAHPKGNHVVISCDEGFEVLYAHARKDSVAINPGERVIKGVIIAKVGNSGNTSEPHLHIQANIGHKPLVLKFEGHSYKRNDLMKI